ncbi:MAG: hypothetical protein IJ225_04970 [Solobacterium sp.]|nr:hypothetical protein [Solobacterium sp.]
MSKKDNRKKHPVLKTAGALAATGAAAYGGYSFLLFTHAFNTDKSRFHPDGIIPNSAETASANEWLKNSDRVDDTLRSYDDLTLHAMRIENHPEAKKWMILLHGFHRCSYDLLPLMMEADRHGYNLLVPDQRASGQSEGTFTGLGWPEHYDLLSWINYLTVLRPEASIVLYGIDMGASAVMNAVGDILPSNVAAAIEEGGYADLKEELVYLAEKNTEIPAKPFIPAVDLLIRQNLHFSMNDISTKRQLNNAKIPMLFLHGSDDQVVPAFNAEVCAASYGGEKELVILESTGFSGCRYHASYFDTIFSFADKYAK